MKNKIFITIILMLVINTAFSQSWYVGIGTGIMSHNQNPLKDINLNVKNSLLFNAKITEDFPVTPYINFNGGYEFKYLSVGVSYTYNSTGSRVTSSDYSGSYYYDQVITGHFAGLNISSSINLYKNWHIKGQTEFGGIFSSLNLKESIAIYNYDNFNDEFDFNAISIYAKPDLQLYYEFNKLRIGLSVGYIIDFRSEFYLKQNRDLYLLNTTTNNVVKSDWNGLTIGFYISKSLYSFGNNKD